MKKLLFIMALALPAIQASAQDEQNQAGQASQTSNLVMSNAIEISFVNTGTTDGGTATLTFSSVNDYANGIESEAYQLLVKSNKKFRIQAKTSSSKFTYTGTTTPAPSMSVSNILFMKVLSNSTGGSVASNFNNKYRSMSSSSQTLVSNCTPGGNKTFSVQYKATPGFAYPAGTYAVNVVYTATQQ